MADQDMFQVAPDMTKHLSRNVQSNFTDYLQQVSRSLRSNNHTPTWRLENTVDEMASCLRSEPSDALKTDLQELLKATLLRYEALNRSVDFHIAPRPVHQALSGVILALERTAHRKLGDEFRDQRAAEDRGLMNIEELDIKAIAFTDARSLAEKVSIARLKLLHAADELKELRDHFEYKRNLTTAGKPGAYSMFYAVFALGDFYALHNERGEKAQVNTFKTVHSGRFLDFVRSFFRIANIAVAEQAGNTFPESVRKIAQKRSVDSECYKLLDGDASTQDLLDFMDRVDRIR